MKNVFKRCLKIIALFDNLPNSNIDSNYIKDNIPEYRELSDGAFKRSFERDKVLLKEVGFRLEYENDKWTLQEGYKLEGRNIITQIKNTPNFNFESFSNTYSVIKKYLSPHFELNQNLKIIPRLSVASREKRRVSFLYNEKLRKVYPLGLRFHNGSWYLGAEDNKIVKTFKISNINDLKVGTKDNLHNNEIKNFTFTWEDKSEQISVQLRSNKNLHNIHKNIFIFTDSNQVIQDDLITLNLVTKDHHGFIKYLLLVSPEITNISSSNRELLLQVINGL